MKNTTKFLGLLLFVAIIGFSFVACEGGAKDALDGTWVGMKGDWKTVLTCNSPNFTMTQSKEGETTVTYSGTYSISGSTVTFTYDGGTIIGTLSGNTLTSDALIVTKQ